MTAEAPTVLIYCDDPSHARGKVVKIATLTRDERGVVELHGRKGVAPRGGESVSRTSHRVDAADSDLLLQMQAMR